MANPKNAARKKKRTSKHVLKAIDERKGSQVGDATTTTGLSAASTTPQQQPEKTQKKSSKKNGKVKDPNDAASYLSAWKHRDAGEAVWKFNKNTQSWLIRRMYEVEKVPKTTFTVLIEYLSGLQGSTRQRVADDATRRAVRYKEYERTNPETEKEEKSDKKDTDSDLRKEAAKSPVDEDETDEQRWKRLDHHEKRKEYKRARLVIDVLK